MCLSSSFVVRGVPRLIARIKFPDSSMYSDRMESINGHPWLLCFAKIVPGSSCTWVISKGDQFLEGSQPHSSLQTSGPIFLSSEILMAQRTLVLCSGLEQ